MSYALVICARFVSRKHTSVRDSYEHLRKSNFSLVSRHSRQITIAHNRSVFAQKYQLRPDPYSHASESSCFIVHGRNDT